MPTFLCPILHTPAQALILAFTLNLHSNRLVISPIPRMFKGVNATNPMGKVTKEADGQLAV